MKAYPEDFQVNEIRLRDGKACEATFDIVTCDDHGCLHLGTERWPTESEEEGGWVKDPLPTRHVGEGEESFRFVMVKRNADTLEALAELSRCL